MNTRENSEILDLETRAINAEIRDLTEKELSFVSGAVLTYDLTVGGYHFWGGRYPDGTMWGCYGDPNGLGTCGGGPG